LGHGFWFFLKLKGEASSSMFNPPPVRRRRRRRREKTEKGAFFHPFP
jgi:hypothetical protein